MKEKGEKEGERKEGIILYKTEAMQVEVYPHKLRHEGDEGNWVI